jgi:hypothetical protein
MLERNNFYNTILAPPRIPWKEQLVNDTIKIAAKTGRENRYNGYWR